MAKGKGGNAKARQLRSFLRAGMRGVAVPTSGLRSASLSHLRAGKAVFGGGVKIGIDADGTKRFIDGRHRTIVARERGAKSIPATVYKYGPRGGVQWSWKGNVKI